MLKIGKILMNGVKELIFVEEQVCLLVHLLIKCIRYYGCLWEEVLKEIMMWAGQIRNFPGRIGGLGNKLFDMAYEELRIPGSEFRRQLRKDFISLDLR
jgi:hypothetical protein